MLLLALLAICLQKSKRSASAGTQRAVRHVGHYN